MENDTYIIVLSTCDSAEMATTIAKNLVSRQLAACVNIVPGIESVYQWQGKIQHDAELLLIIKTRQACFEALQNAIGELHSYELPEIIAVPVQSGEKNYLDWIKSTTATTEIK